MSKEHQVQSGKKSFEVKVGLAEMLKGGLVVGVESYEQAKIAEDAGAVAVLAIETPSLKMSAGRGETYFDIIQSIQSVVSIPVIAQCRRGHFVEAQILEALFVDFIYESENLVCVDEQNDIEKDHFKIPFVCGSSSLFEALKYIDKGAAMIKTKEEKGEKKISSTVKILRSFLDELRVLSLLNPSELEVVSQKSLVPYSLLEQVSKERKIPVPLFAAGPIVTPADIALMMHLGAEGICIDAQVFSLSNPFLMIKSLVASISHYKDPEMLMRISKGIFDEAKAGEMDLLPKDELLTPRGW